MHFFFFYLGLKGFFPEEKIIDSSNGKLLFDRLTGNKLSSECNPSKDKNVSGNADSKLSIFCLINKDKIDSLENDFIKK
jgi:hypothetical protein